MIKRKHDIINWVWLIISIFIILLVTLGRPAPLNQRKSILTPFSTLIAIVQSNWKQHGYYVARGVVGNILLFIPFGVIITKIRFWHSTKDIFKVTLLAASISFVIETIQYFS